MFLKIKIIFIYRNALVPQCTLRTCRTAETHSRVSCLLLSLLHRETRRLPCPKCPLKELCKHGVTSPLTGAFVPWHLDCIWWPIFTARRITQSQTLFDFHIESSVMAISSRDHLQLYCVTHLHSLKTLYWAGMHDRCPLNFNFDAR